MASSIGFSPSCPLGGTFVRPEIRYGKFRDGADIIFVISMLVTTVSVSSGAAMASVHLTLVS